MNIHKSSILMWQVVSWMPWLAMTPKISHWIVKSTFMQSLRINISHCYEPTLAIGMRWYELLLFVMICVTIRRWFSWFSWDEIGMWLDIFSGKTSQLTVRITKKCYHKPHHFGVCPAMMVPLSPCFYRTRKYSQKQVIYASFN